MCEHQCKMILTNFANQILSIVFHMETLTLAKVSIERIRVKWRWTNTFTRLHAFLIGFTLVVACASFLSRRTQTVVWVSAITVWTNTLMRSWQVYAFCSVATYLVSNDTLVYICK